MLKLQEHLQEMGQHQSKKLLWRIWGIVIELVSQRCFWCFRLSFPRFLFRCSCKQQSFLITPPTTHPKHNPWFRILSNPGFRFRARTTSCGPWSSGMGPWRWSPGQACGRRSRTNASVPTFSSLVLSAWAEALPSREASYTSEKTNYIPRQNVP